MAQQQQPQQQQQQQQQRQFQVGGGNADGGGPTGDTTYTKIFVGGLAWETQRETMRRYFEHFGEIQEAVVIRDKNTGRSKGYGFVTFKDAESARRACQDSSPVIDGRRANCNLACLGAATHHRSRPPTPGQHGFGRFRPLSAAYHGPSTPATTAYFHQPTHYALPFSVYGYSGGYSQENMYPMSYYSVGGGGGGAGGHHHQFSPYYAAAAAAAAELGVFPNFYPYYAQYAQGSQGQGSGFGLQYPQMLQYPYGPQSYGAGILSLPASVAASTVGNSVLLDAAGVTPAPVGPSPSQQPGMAAEQKSLA
ncbi:hypothetical protein Taro_019221 [Colocasia esculenta]|uniref:RRM domain-containing protein n=1 Tax=Colocasia esculenta TaxID=4460 RepID=A0A843UT78_COLES|nr:hypothetical protein [Colocasia esculenta]